MFQQNAALPNWLPRNSKKLKSGRMNDSQVGNYELNDDEWILNASYLILLKNWSTDDYTFTYSFAEKSAK